MYQSWEIFSGSKCPECRTQEGTISIRGPVVILLTLLILGCTAGNDRTRSCLEPVIKALATYKADKGVYPYELSRLVPEYLSELPDGPKKYSYVLECREYYLVFTHAYPRMGWGKVDNYCSKTGKWYVHEDTEGPEICRDFEYCNQTCTHDCEEIWDEDDICCR